MSGPGKVSDSSTHTAQANTEKNTSSNAGPQSIYPQMQASGSGEAPTTVAAVSSTPSNSSDASTTGSNEPAAPLLDQSGVNTTTPSYAPKPNLDEGLKPRIVVIGVGGAGCNAINNMIRSELAGVDFFVANTDAQALEQSDAAIKIQLGLEATHGLGAGSHPEMGRASAEESIHDVLQRIGGSHMLFVTAGMGGGTGTGAAPVIAKAAREHGILTVGVVTKPFHFEGAKRMRVAESGIEELQKYVDTLIVIPNQNLFRVANEKTTFVDAFKMADEVLYSGVRSVTDLMMKPGLINLDFADVKAVMGEMMGKAMMGTGEAEGDSRAIDAAEAAISSPLLDDVSMKGAKAVLINITGGMDMTLFEADEAANRIREEVDPNAHIIFGSTFDESLEGKIRVSCVATGIDAHSVVAASVSQPSSTMRPDRMQQPQVSETELSHTHNQRTASTEGSTTAPIKPEEERLTPPHIRSVEEELGVSFDEDDSTAEIEAESTYDIYSSLRKDIGQKEGVPVEPLRTNSHEEPKPLEPAPLKAERITEHEVPTDQPPLFRSVNEEPTRASTHLSGTQSESTEPKEDKTQEHRSFFSRLMGRKKNSSQSASGGQRKLGLAAQPTKLQQAAPSESSRVTENDDLDVPAFLRRKDRH